jgi:LmbE family N-acetylglucosaminyl deacetylase
MPSPERVLIFCPHPDDVELFMGGTLLRHLTEGATARVVMMTCGEKGSILSLLGPAKMAQMRRIRIAEIEGRHRLIPSVEVSFFNLPDRDVRLSDETVERASAEFTTFSPTCVYLPESVKEQTFYLHPDHLATGLIAETASTKHPAAVIRRYFHSRQPNTFVDVSPFHEENLRGLRCYKTQYSWHTGIPFLLRHYEKVRTRRTREYGRQLGVEFAEAFRQVE